MRKIWHQSFQINEENLTSLMERQFNENSKIEAKELKNVIAGINAKKKKYIDQLM